MPIENLDPKQDYKWTTLVGKLVEVVDEVNLLRDYCNSLAAYIEEMRPGTLDPAVLTKEASKDV